uniref:Ribonuclease H-like domain, reverse transcriptase, RNA-dependent DNA polymerase n=1 Tax=Tanacetum cinerariifolium TaxID=118510 RepID=A0A699GK94_TANCI|nr:ribonuclease H-like domain, reverse transcriptase, RNA-dependent DNA polymerase [Tanacetum cinerariifolium]
MDYLLWSDMKIMFEPHVKDEVWKMQQGYKVLEWKLRRYKSTTTTTNSINRSPQMVSSVKLPILRKCSSDDKDDVGNEVEVPPINVQQILARTRERKAKSTLLMAIPDENLARFHESTNNNNEHNAAYSASTTIGHSSQAQEQINQDDLEEIDLKWQVAMLSMSVKQFYKKTGRNLEFNGKELVGFDKTKVECFNCHRRGHFARDCRTAKNSRNKSRDVRNVGYIGRDNEKKATDFALMALTSNPSCSSSSNSELDEALREKEDLKAKLKKFETSLKNLTKLLDNKINAKDKTGLGYDSQFNEKEVLNVKEEEVTKTVFDNCSSDEEISLVNDKFKKGKGYHAIPPPLTGNYMYPESDLSFTGLDDSIYKFKISETVTSLTKDENDALETSTAFVEKTKEVRTISVVKGNKVTAVMTSTGCVWRPRVNEIDQICKDNRCNCTRVDYGHPQQALKNKGRVESGCSRHMTGNKAYLADYQEINDGGFVGFGSCRGKITRKGPQDTNGNAATQDNVDARKEVHDQHYIVLLLCSSIFFTFKSSDDKAADDKPKDDTGSKTVEKPANKEDQAYKDELDRLMSQEKEASDAADTIRKEFEQGCMDQSGATKAGSTKSYITVSNLVNAAITLETFSAGGPSSPHPDVFIPANTLLHVDQNDSQIPDLEDTVELKKADFNKMESSTIVSPIPTHKVYINHPKDQILGDPKSAVQTRGMAKKSSGAHAFVSYIHKQRRTNYKDYENCFFACFLSQIEPKKKAIRTKWVYRNKKDERDIVVRNKARLVAQGHRQQEGIDYDKVFAHVARIKGINIFLAFATFMGSIVYQMDVKSTFLYGIIEEEVYVCQPLGFIDPQFLNMVYKVKKALYGLHQAPKACFDALKILDEFHGGAYILLKTTASTPIETQKLFVKDKEHADVDVHLYRSMIGSLMYLTASRPDIMFAFCTCSRFQVTPKLLHLHAVKQIFSQIPRQTLEGTGFPRTKGPNFPDPSVDVEAVHKDGVIVWEKVQVVVSGAMKPSEAKDIASLKKRVTKLEQRKRSRILGFHPFRAGTSKIHSLDEDVDTEMIVKDKGNGEKGGSIAKAVSTARPDISVIRPEVSTTKPETHPTTSTLFDYEDVTIVATLVNIKNQKAKEKGIAFKDADDSVRPIRSITTLQPFQPLIKKIKASKAALAKMYDEVQAQIDADHELAIRLTHKEQEKYTIEERTKLLTEFFERRKKQLGKERAESRSFEEIQKLYIKKQKWVDAFVPIGSKDDEKKIGSRKKRAAGTNKEGDVHVYKLTRLDGSYRHFLTFSSTLEVLDRQDVLDLHKINTERFLANDLEGYDLILWGDLKTLVESSEDDEI